MITLTAVVATLVMLVDCLAKRSSDAMDRGGRPNRLGAALNQGFILGTKILIVWSTVELRWQVVGIARSG